jgi:DNA primase
VSSLTEEIKARVDLVELIGRTVQLKRVGSAYRGLCPFHTEKTPSFYVRPQTNTYHCFGCAKSGSAFDWLMERDQLEFSEALRILADMAGVTLPERRTPEAEEQYRRIYAILERAQTYYAGLLWGSSGERARAYLERRGLSEETLRNFGIGYAGTGNGLLRYLANEGFAEQELQAAGVIGTSDDGRPYDFFRDRVLFPIRDVQGRTIAFGGRSLDDGSTPKYLNSRDTLVFHKHETLFALDQARRALAQERQVVIVEGYVDAIMAHQHGYRTVVATLGTAITEQHLRVLRRSVDEIRLALDPDAAGQAATWRALQVADASLRTGFAPVVGPSRRQQRVVPDRAARLLIMALPDGKDPDELIRSDPNAWTALVRQALPVVDFVVERLAARHDLTTAHGKAAAAEEVVEALAGIANPIEQDHYVHLAADTLKVDAAAIRRLLRRTQRGAARREAPPEAPRAQGEGAAPQPLEVKGDTDDEYLLALLMHMRALPEMPPLEGELDFVLAENRALYRVLAEGGTIPPELEPYAERARHRLADVERLPPHRLAADVEFVRNVIRTRLLDTKRQELNALLREGADEVEVAALLVKNAQQLPPERESVGTR